MFKSIIRISKAVAIGAVGIQAIGLVVVGGGIMLLPAAVAFLGAAVASLESPHSEWESYDDMGGGSL